MIARSCMNLLSCCCCCLTLLPSSSHTRSPQTTQGSSLSCHHEEGGRQAGTVREARRHRTLLQARERERIDVWISECVRRSRNTRCTFPSRDLTQRDRHPQGRKEGDGRSSDAAANTDRSGNTRGADRKGDTRQTRQQQRRSERVRGSMFT